jgi:oxygen-independent coproporphyrinogen III oxidase
MSSSDSIDIRFGDETVALPLDVLERYNVHGPRYTSYPTAPEWTDSFGPADTERAYATADPKADVSLYFHIPFCESLCWYCGCNVVIQRDKAVSTPYLDRVKLEADRVTGFVDPAREVVQFHWGGGTPTYLSPEQMTDLFRFTADRVRFSPEAEIGVEVDPRVTTHEHVEALSALGFNRISMGVQDFDPKVQEAVNRVQSFEETSGLVDDCRAHGFTSVNIDLMYGLPYQTLTSFMDTVDRVIEISPDRVALFNYAHVPQLRHAQKAFHRMPLPEGMEKFDIFRHAIGKFSEAGYVFIGLDHFAKPTDELAVAQRDRTLRRNFQGYSTKSGSDLYGMGVSAIGYVGGAFTQNFRDTPSYYAAIEAGTLATMRGKWLDADDFVRQAVIERLLCHCVLVIPEIEADFGIEFRSYFAEALVDLTRCEGDGLVTISDDRIEVTTLGRLFIRNLAMPFDAYLRQQAPGTRPVFSKTL